MLSCEVWHGGFRIPGKVEERRSGQAVEEHSSMCRCKAVHQHSCGHIHVLEARDSNVIVDFGVQLAIWIQRQVVPVLNPC